MMFTGLGPKDALTLPRSFYKRRRDRHPALEDRRAGVLARARATLAAILAEAPPHDATTLCANSDGRPWTVERLPGLLAADPAQAGGGRAGSARA